VLNCYLQAYGTGTGYEIIVGASFVERNYCIAHGIAAIGADTANTMILGNIIYCPGNTGGIYMYQEHSEAIGNAIYAVSGNTGAGIFINESVRNTQQIRNNIACNFSGAGGRGIDMDLSDVRFLGYNAFYNNTAEYADLSMVFIDERANDVALAADPFTNAAAGDFSLTAAAKAALAGKGFPVDYLGAAAATVSNLNIGPIQLAATAPVAATRGLLIIPRR
jgi:hypothetical protein